MAGKAALCLVFLHVWISKVDSQVGLFGGLDAGRNLGKGGGPVTERHIGKEGGPTTEINLGIRGGPDTARSLGKGGGPDTGRSLGRVGGLDTERSLGKGGGPDTVRSLGRVGGSDTGGGFVTDGGLGSGVDSAGVQSGSIGSSTQGAIGGGGNFITNMARNILTSVVRIIVHPNAEPTPAMLDVAYKQNGLPANRTEVMEYIPHLTQLALDMGIRIANVTGTPTFQQMRRYIAGRVFQAIPNYSGKFRTTETVDSTKNSAQTTRSGQVTYSVSAANKGSVGIQTKPISNSGALRDAVDITALGSIGTLQPGGTSQSQYSGLATISRDASYSVSTSNLGSVGVQTKPISSPGALRDAVDITALGSIGTLQPGGTSDTHNSGLATISRDASYSVSTSNLGSVGVQTKPISNSGNLSDTIEFTSLGSISNLEPDGNSGLASKTRNVSYSVSTESLGSSGDQAKPIRYSESLSDTLQITPIGSVGTLQPAGTSVTSGTSSSAAVTAAEELVPEVTESGQVGTSGVPVASRIPPVVNTVPLVSGSVSNNFDIFGTGGTDIWGFPATSNTFDIFGPTHTANTFDIWGTSNSANLWGPTHTTDIWGPTNTFDIWGPAGTTDMFGGPGTTNNAGLWGSSGFANTYDIWNPVPTTITAGVLGQTLTSNTAGAVGQPTSNGAVSLLDLLKQTNASNTVVSPGQTVAATGQTSPSNTVGIVAPANVPQPSLNLDTNWGTTPGSLWDPIDFWGPATTPAPLFGWDTATYDVAASGLVAGSSNTIPNSSINTVQSQNGTGTNTKVSHVMTLNNNNINNNNNLNFNDPFLPVFLF